MRGGGPWTPSRFGTTLSQSRDLPWILPYKISIMACACRCCKAVSARQAVLPPKSPCQQYRSGTEGDKTYISGGISALSIHTEDDSGEHTWTRKSPERGHFTMLCIIFPHRNMTDTSPASCTDGRKGWHMSSSPCNSSCSISAWPLRTDSGEVNVTRIVPLELQAMAGLMMMSLHSLSSKALLN